MNKMMVFVLLLAATLGFGFLYKRASAFPPVGVACFEQFMNAAQSGYADPDLNVPAFDMRRVSHFRCASAKGSVQYEISGTDRAGRQFYVHHSGGGTAASGADSMLDHCYKSDGVIVKSIRQSGHGPEQEGSCVFDEHFPADPESAYTYLVAQTR